VRNELSNKSNRLEKEAHIVKEERTVESEWRTRKRSQACIGRHRVGEDLSVHHLPDLKTGAGGRLAPPTNGIDDGPATLSR
jgi:hypothetical protein